ncbi:MAG: AI-2E family transporter [Chloroflexota bacterium]|nr:AI-2E family transporter [Chloroflexota bacterium]
MNGEPQRPGYLSGRTKLVIVLALCFLAIAVLLQIRSILAPFLWSLLAAYLLAPVVRYLNVDARLPRLWSVALIYAGIGLLLIASSRYLYPRLIEQGTVFLEDLPRLEGALIGLVGPRPLGIDITSVVQELLGAVGGFTNNARSAGHLLVNAFETVFKLFLFLVTTFYLLMDGTRLRTSLSNAIPPSYRPELSALARQINLTWQQYIRGELLLFAIMATATAIGLTILGVPGALFLGLVTGALELLPIVGPYTAGTLAVSVAYFNGSNPFGMGQIAYAGVVALMYFVFRETEDYVVIPHVLGRAVRLHPLVVLFSVTAGGIIGGLFGLIVAVPIAASLKAILTYLYAKLLDLPIQFEPVRTLGGGVIEIPVHDIAEDHVPEGTGKAQPGTPR